ncbi:OmpH family outer membrane protein [Xanthocytophaga agilis]|uniref:OmpH family outer membrane protein n=1 Tax=Xanthocytophaga agilis TaxID=3048010 RepID=A0AAE3UEA8_9BACT|nr:OmpH family outer membrane protein [Xanthocytophaga agilis]MDJ1501166.1 OmpH family outer membrane protein [Xanthocytophaga agilis]
MNRYFQIGFYILVTVSIAVLYILYFKRANTEVVYVDSAKLLNGYQAMVNARTEYEQKAKGWQANVDTLMQEVQTAIKEHEKQIPSMSAKERDLSRQVIESKQRQLAQYQQAIAEKARQEDVKLTKQVVDQVNAFLDRYGKEHGYQIILAANQTGNIAYAQKKLDITEDVLAIINQEYSHK